MTEKFKWSTCDTCNKSTGYSPEDPFIELRQRRPSNHADMACTLAGHLKCIQPSLDARQLPRISDTGGVATPEQWETWIENEGAKKGFLWIS